MRILLPEVFVTHEISVIALRTEQVCESDESLRECSGTDTSCHVLTGKKTQSRHHSLSHCLLVFMIRKASGGESRDTVLANAAGVCTDKTLNIHQFKTNNHLQLT